MTNNFTSSRSAPPIVHCVKVSEPVGVSYQVSDFDSGDLEVGDTATCNFTVDVPAGYEVEIDPIPGYTFAGNAPNFSVSWAWQGASNPQQALTADIISPDGLVGELSGGDFFLCSGGGGDPTIELLGEGSVKEYCRRGKPSIWQDEQGNEVNPAELEFCESPQSYQIDCWKQQFYECGLDNTFTSFRDTGASITLRFADCPESSFDIPDGTGGWTAQVAAISAGLASVLTDSFQHATFCTNGCGGLPKPIVELPDMKWRYAGWRTCPGDKTPIEAVYNSDQRKGVLLDLNVIFTDIQYFDRCIDTETKEVEWRDCRTGELADPALIADGKPLCAIPCADQYPDLPDVELCSSGVENGCFFTQSENGPVQTLAGVTQLWKVCGEIVQVQYVTNYGADDQAEVAIPEGGYFGDCATGDPISPPAAECEKVDVDLCLVDGCESGFRASIGRPSGGVWTLTESDGTVIAGDGYGEFRDAMLVAGYCEWISGPTIESHRFCPFPEGATFTVNGENVELVKVLYEDDKQRWPKPPVYKCVGWQQGKNDDRRDDLLQEISGCQKGIKKALTCCPKLDVGDATLTTGANAGSIISLPHSAGPDGTEDFMIPFSIGEHECLDDPDQALTIRWCMLHYVDASSSHIGFNVSAVNGIGTIVASSGAANVDIGPAIPHGDVTTKQWVDAEYTVAELQAGQALQTSAFGTTNQGTERIIDQWIELKTDLSEQCNCS